MGSDRSYCGASVDGVDDGILEIGMGDAFVGGDESGAYVGGAGTETDDCGKTSSVGDAAGGDDRNFDGVDDLGTSVSRERLSVLPGPAASVPVAMTPSAPRASALRAWWTDPTTLNTVIPASFRWPV